MIRRKSLGLTFLLNLIIAILSGPLQRWTVDIIEIKSYSADPDIAYFEAEMVRLGRGKFGVNGYGYTNIDANDDTVFHITCEKSLHRDGPYHPTLFGNLSETLTNVMNKFYKPLVQPIFENCCKNCPIIKTVFVPPLTKRHVKFTNCEVSVDNMPNYMPMGYYKTRIAIAFPIKAYFEWIAYIENKVF